MSHRFLLCGFLVASAGAFGQSAATVAAKPAAGKTDAAAWTQGKTADGQPDLQGIWSNASDIPLERPKNLASKEFYSSPEEKAAAIKARNGRPDAVAVPEAHYDLSQFGLEQGQSKFAANLRTSLIVGPEGQIPALLPAAQKRNAERAAKVKGHEFDMAQNRPLGERCIMWPQEGPPMMPLGYNNNMEFVQGPGYVAILNEMIHDVRMIPLDGRPHVGQDIRQWRGDSRGHWEGNTLVVDTTNFTAKTAFRGSSENLHVVERFTRTGKDTLLYEFTVDDPSTWEKSWTAQVVMGPASGEIFEYACQEGNYGMANNLSGARAEEKKVAEEAAKK